MASKASRVDGFEPDIEVAVALGLPADRARMQADRFMDFWRGKPGKDGLKKDWLATWRNWVRNEIERHGTGSQPFRVVGGQQAPPQKLKSVGHRIGDKMLGRSSTPEPNPDDWRTIDAYATRN